ncbi:alpha/beta hydrolase [Rhodophyticola porphyridii]|uniref:alpha/beta hydrolase n=1 Tax=Rhodophyticola porphyridii TaxID=1852017 RepID=UPI0035CF502E
MTASLTENPLALYADCELFEQTPRNNWLMPVASDLPVLVFSGEIDTQTASSWGPLAAETLTNSQAIVFPETGHGALLFSQCARDIGAAFLEAPEGEINTSCIADLRLPYLMPDGSFLDVQ